MDERMSNRRVGSDDGPNRNGTTPASATQLDDERGVLALDGSELSRFHRLVDTIQRDTWERSAIGDDERDRKRELLAADEDS
jgi:hypothetical protein